MVDLDTGQINEIGYYKKLANDAWIKNMQLVFVIDARIIQIKIKNEANP